MSEYTKKLHIRKDGTTEDISLYTSTSDLSNNNNKLILEDGSTKIYAQLGDITNKYASSLRIRKSDTIYAVLKQIILYSLSYYYQRIVNYSTITSLPEENANYIKEALPNVTNCYKMLYGCSKLTSIDTIGWDTSKVSDMMFMFGDCSSLKTLDISNWDTSNVSDMCYMFSFCRELTTIKGIIDMKSCTKYDGMFMACLKLTGVKIKNPPSGITATSGIGGLAAGKYEIVS